MAGSEKLVISDLVLKLTGISKGFFSGQTYWLLVFGGSKLLLNNCRWNCASNLTRKTDTIAYAIAYAIRVHYRDFEHAYVY